MFIENNMCDLECTSGDVLDETTFECCELEVMFSVITHQAPYSIIYSCSKCVSQ